jgi:hypothetical protein
MVDSSFHISAISFRACSVYLTSTPTRHLFPFLARSASRVGSRLTYKPHLSGLLQRGSVVSPLYLGVIYVY